MENRTVSGIFNQAPSNWGLRGDPYFWDDLKQHFKDFSLPYSINSFVDELNRYFEKVTGERLTRGCQVNVPKYSHGGLSSGTVSGAYWIEHGIPLLIKRLEEANADTRQSRSIFFYEEQARIGGISLIVVSSLILLTIGSLLAIYKTSPYLLVFVLYSIIYIPLLAMGIQQLRLHSGIIEIHDDCIEYKCGHKTRVIPFQQIEKITFHNGFFRVIKLYTPQGPILISKKIQDYQKLYKILADNITQLKVIHEGPVIIRTGIFTTYGAATCVVLMFCALVYFSVNGYIQGRTPLFMALFLGGLGVFFAVFIVVSMLSKPYQFRLDHDGITEFAIIRSKLYPKNSIKTIHFGQIRALYHTRLKHYRMVNYIKFIFTDMPPLSIDDRFSNYPIELAVSYAKEVYGITPIYLNIEKL
jgi:hypothetical protein